MAKIKIDASLLMTLMEEHSGFMRGYLDKRTGEILQVFEDDPDGLNQEIYDTLDAEPDRYVSIEPIGSHEGYRIMERFVEGLPDSEDRRLLKKVLLWKKPFSNFKSAIADMGDLRQQWFEFHDKELCKIAMEWLKEEEIDAELVLPTEAYRQEAAGDAG